MFVALGMTATGLGQTLQDNRAVLRQISGVVIALLGVLFIATLFVPKLNREWRPEELMRRAHTGGPIIAGLAFAVAWLPCTGPTLGAILTAASQESTVGRGGVLLAFYALGLAVPFILSALAFTTFSGIFRFFRNHYTAITLVSGLILIAMGVLLFTNELTAELGGPPRDGRSQPELLQRDLAGLPGPPDARRASGTAPPSPGSGSARRGGQRVEVARAPVVDHSAARDARHVDQPPRARVPRGPSSWPSSIAYTGTSISGPCSSRRPR